MNSQLSRWCEGYSYPERNQETKSPFNHRAIQLARTQISRLRFRINKLTLRLKKRKFFSYNWTITASFSKPLENVCSALALLFLGAMWRSRPTTYLNGQCIEMVQHDMIGLREQGWVTLFKKKKKEWLNGVKCTILNQTVYSSSKIFGTVEKLKTRRYYFF